MRTEVITFSDFMDTPDWNKPRNVRFLGADLQMLAIALWTASAAFAGSTGAYANTVVQQDLNLWGEMFGLFGVFQDMIMVLGALSIFAGLMTMIFKKRLGTHIVTSSIVIIGGCFLVPAAIMLLSIIGNMLNGTLMEVFQNMQLKGSVPVN